MLIEVIPITCEKPLSCAVALCAACTRRIPPAFGLTVAVNVPVPWAPGLIANLPERNFFLFSDAVIVTN